MGQIKELQEKCHNISKEKGFYDGHDIAGSIDERHPAELIALMHAELSEGLEALRGKAEDNNLGEEMADTVIRIFDACEYWGIDLEHEILKKMEKNKVRPYLHGKKF